MNQDRPPNYMEGFESSADKPKESKLWTKVKENPFVPAGVLSAIGALGYSAYKFKNRGDQKVSVYLIHTRVAAQGLVVSALTLGVLYHMFNEYVLHKPPKNDK